MILKPYNVPLPLQMMRCLIPRYELSPKEKQDYIYLEKGHEGELKFASLLENLSNDLIIMHDLLLECDNNIFQIDALLLKHKTIYLFEVKNFAGDFYIESDIWYTGSGKEIKNPLLQLSRCESLLRQFLQKSGFNFPIKGNVIFINSEFTLYQAPLHLPIILPTQLNRFLNQFNMSSPKPNNNHIKLADKLVSSHLDDRSYHRLPHYHYDQLKKGIVCMSCNSLTTSLMGRRVVCDHCGSEENVDTSIRRSIQQFQLLFPDKKITTSIIQEWCGIGSDKTIRRILGSYFKMKWQGKNTYYVDSNG